MAIEFKVSTPTQKVINLAIDSQKELERVSIQIASGEKYGDFVGYAQDGNVGKLISFKEIADSSTAYTRSNDLIIARNNFADQSLEQLQNIASDVASLITKRRNGASGDVLPITSEAQGYLNEIEGSLNVQFDGIHIFSGSKSDTPAVSNLQTSNLDENDLPTANFYQGNDQAPSIKISDSQELTYGVTGNNQAFQELVGAIHLALKGDAENSDATLGEALDLINSAVNGLANARSVILSANVSLKNANSVHSDIDLVINENLTDITGTDIVEATTIMKEIEAQVQATFTAFSRLSNLRLSNFL